MGMYLPYALSNDQTKSFIKEHGAHWCHNYKIWRIPKASYTAVRT